MAATLFAYALTPAEIDRLALANDIRRELHGKTPVATLPIASSECLCHLMCVCGDWNFDIFQSDCRIIDLIAWKRHALASQGLNVELAVSRKQAHILSQKIREFGLDTAFAAANIRSAFGNPEEYTADDMHEVIQLLVRCVEYFKSEDECVVIFATEGFEDAP